LCIGLISDRHGANHRDYEVSPDEEEGVCRWTEEGRRTKFRREIGRRSRDRQGEHGTSNIEDEGRLLKMIVRRRHGQARRAVGESAGHRGREGPFAARRRSEQGGGCSAAAKPEKKPRSETEARPSEKQAERKQAPSRSRARRDAGDARSRTAVPDRGCGDEKPRRPAGCRAARAETETPPQALLRGQAARVAASTKSTRIEPRSRSASVKGSGPAAAYTFRTRPCKARPAIELRRLGPPGGSAWRQRATSKRAVWRRPAMSAASVATEATSKRRSSRSRRSRCGTARQMVPQGEGDFTDVPRSHMRKRIRAA